MRESSRTDESFDTDGAFNESDSSAEPASMTDGTITSTTVARYLDADHRGSSVELAGVESLSNAGPGDLAFCVYESAGQLQESSAGAILCPPTLDRTGHQTEIVVDDPRLAFAKAAERFFSPRVEKTTRAIHPSASVHDDARIGRETRIGPRVTIGPSVAIGEGCRIRANTAIGGAGFGFARDDTGTPRRIPHHGGVKISSDVEIGQNCSIDRGVFEKTTIGDSTKLSGQVHVGHNVTIGSDTLVTFGVGFGGGATVGDRVMIHPHAAIGEGLVIGDDAEVGMNSTVLEDVPSGTTVVGSPAVPIEIREEDSHE